MLSVNGVVRGSLALVGLAVAGCSAPVVDDVASAHEETTQGVVLIERTEGAEGNAQTNVSAKFMRMSVVSDPETAERVVGTQLDLPAIDECSVLAPSESPDEIGASLAVVGSIKLLDVGDVTIHAGDTFMSLAPRAFPDVGDLVSGVFYTSRDAANDLPAPANYELRTSGTAAFEGFAIEASAPPGPSRVSLQDRDLAEDVTLPEGVPAVVRWGAFPRTVRDRAKHESDVVYVDVAPRATGVVIRCSFRDTGAGSIPGALLRSETLGSLPATVTVGLHRVRRVPFGAAVNGDKAGGIESGEVRFDIGVLGRVTIEPAAR